MEGERGNQNNQNQNGKRRIHSPYALRIAATLSGSGCTSCSNSFFAVAGAVAVAVEGREERGGSGYGCGARALGCTAVAVEGGDERGGCGACALCGAVTVLVAAAVDGVAVCAAGGASAASGAFGTSQLDSRVDKFW